MRHTIGRMSETWQCGAMITTSPSQRQQDKRIWSWTYRKWNAEHAPVHGAGVGREMQVPLHTREGEKIWHGPSDPQNVLHYTIESILTGCITTWYGDCLASDRKAVQRVVRMAQYITGAKLPVRQNIYTRRCQRKALKNVKDTSHPSHRLFSLLQHGKQYRST
jgi:hypothetical protein